MTDRRARAARLRATAARSPGATDKFLGRRSITLLALFVLCVVPAAPAVHAHLFAPAAGPERTTPGRPSTRPSPRPAPTRARRTTSTRSRSTATTRDLMLVKKGRNRARSSTPTTRPRRRSSGQGRGGRSNSRGGSTRTSTTSRGLVPAELPEAALQHGRRRGPQHARGRRLVGARRLWLRPLPVPGQEHPLRHPDRDDHPALPGHADPDLRDLHQARLERDLAAADRPPLLRQRLQRLPAAPVLHVDPARAR